MNVDSRTLEDTLKQLKNPNVARRHAFSNAEDHVFTLMSKDSYPRFMRSQIYRGVLTAAQQQGLAFSNQVVVESVLLMYLPIVQRPMPSVVCERSKIYKEVADFRSPVLTE